MESEFVIHGPKPVTLLEGKTLGDVFYNALFKYRHLPEALVNVNTNRKLSYEDLLTNSCQLANSMTQWGMSSKDIIAVVSENTEQYCIPVLSSLYLGIPLAPLSHNYTERELSNMISLIKPTIVFCSTKCLHKVLSLKPKFQFIKKIITLCVTNTNSEVETLEGFIQNNSEFEMDLDKFQPTSFDSDKKIAFIMCSSGTTGPPKAVLLTHTNARIRLIHSQHKDFTPVFGPESSVLQVMPMNHALGMGMTLSYFLSGYRVVLMEAFEFKLFLESLQNYKIVFTVVVPPILVLLTKSSLVSNYDLSSLKFIGCGGAPLKKELCEAVITRFKNIGIVQGYGLTECSTAIILTDPVKSKLGSVGRVTPLLTTKVVDPSTGRALGPNEIGEICFKGPAVMKGYLNDPKATAEVIDECGWLHSGDVGYYDEDLDFYVIDRLKDIIKFKGFQVSPSEVEQVLMENPKILYAGVVGRSDELAGELPAACVVVQPGNEISESEVKNFVQEKLSYPNYLRGGVYFVDAIPISNTGKVNRKELRTMFKKLISKL